MTAYTEVVQEHWYPLEAALTLGQISAFSTARLRPGDAPRSQATLSNLLTGALRTFEGWSTGLVAPLTVAALVSTLGTVTMAYIPVPWTSASTYTFTTVNANGVASTFTTTVYRDGITETPQFSARTGFGSFYWNQVSAAVRLTGPATAVWHTQVKVADTSALSDASLFGTPYWTVLSGHLGVSSTLTRGMTAIAWDGVYTRGTGTVRPQFLPLQSENYVFTDQITTQLAKLVAEALTLAAPVTVGLAAQIVEAVRLGAPLSSLQTAYLTVAEGARLQAVTLAALALTVQGAFTAHTSTSLGWAVALYARLTTLGSPVSRFIAALAVSGAILARGSLQSGKGASIQEWLTLTTAPHGALHATLPLAEEILLTTMPTGHLALLLYLNDEALLIDPPSAQTPFNPFQLFNLLVSEGVVAKIGYRALDGTFLGMVVNTTSQAATQYTGWTFNSFCRLQGQFYGASAQGVAALGADTDNGAAIVATLQTAVTDFGNSYLKRCKAAYLGITAHGQILFQTLTDDGVSRVYALVPDAPGVHTERVLLSRGVTSRYWGFSLTNKDGQDFRVEAVSVLPVQLERRI